MKLLFLSNSIGGLMNFRREFIDQLRKRNHEVHISSPIEASTEYFESIGCKIHPIVMSQRGTNPIKELSLLKDYDSLIEKVKPDIVLSYTIKPNIYGSVVCHKRNIPIIASVTGLGTAVENDGILQKISILLMKWGLSKADHVFFQNQESIGFFNEKGIRLKSKQLVAGSGVNLDKFHKVDYPVKNINTRFLFTGRIIEGKGIGLYLEAAKELKREFPETEYHIIGIKDDIDLTALVEEYHKNGIVVFHGQKNDVRPIIELVHCQVHPTYYPEGMSNVLLESAAMGRPAITTDKSGCKEIVEDGVTGFIIPQRSKKELIDKMRKFINMSWEEKKRMGDEARKKVEKEFDRQVVINDYIQKIEELTDNKI